MLIDVHAHFYHARTPRADWRERNESRLAAGSKIGISVHVASILGSFGFTSPTYFPSPRDVTAGNDALLALHRACARRDRALPRCRHDRDQAGGEPASGRSTPRPDCRARVAAPRPRVTAHLAASPR